jgi:hypothetical protein
MKTQYPALEDCASRSANHTDSPDVTACESALVEETNSRALSEWLTVQPKVKDLGDIHG